MSDIVVELPEKGEASTPAVVGAGKVDQKARLESLAKKIVKCHDKSCESFVDAAIAIAEARKLFKRRKGFTWTDWCTQKLDLGQSRVRELLQIGKSGNPALALQELRAKTAARVKKNRDSKPNAVNANATPKSESPPLCNGDLAQPERKKMAYWAEHADIDAVKEVLAQAMKLDPKPFNPTE